jgi:hypothetical protein
VVPLTSDLSRLHLTVSRRFLEKLESLRLARSHARPAATTAELLEEAVDRMLAREGKRRTGASSRPLSRPRPASPDQVPAYVRRYVWERDGGCCRWPIEGGGVCGSKLRLEIDHIVPRARGGPSTPGNLRLLCGFHNAEAARRSFGEGWMAQFGRKAAPSRGRW